jgi:beta-lactamase regulating signal transducer with metallopeptidase domain
VWSAPSIQTFGDDYAPAKNRGYLSLPTPIGTSTLSSDHVALAALTLFSLLLLAGGIAMSRSLYKLYKLQRQAFLIKKIGRVRVLVSDSVGAPFSFWLPRQAYIVLPAGLLRRQTDFKMAVAHELQHHRSGDTRWVYVLWMLRLICLLNPAIHLWNRWLSELQEFACDETLVDRKKVATLAYARCLVEVAQTAVGLRRPPVCATGLTFLTQRNLLKRRIEANAFNIRIVPKI